MVLDLARAVPPGLLGVASFHGILDDPGYVSPERLPAKVGETLSGTSGERSIIMGLLMHGR